MSREGRDIRRNLDPERGDPAVQVVEIVAELEGTDTQALPSLWGCMDHVLDHIFSDPPLQEAEVQVAFNYQGYRITVEQDGRAEFVKLE